MTQPRRALAATLLVQTMVSLTLVSASVLAPAVAPTLGIAAERIGVFAAVAYLVAMLAGLHAGGWAARLGAVRLSQAALLACAAGALLAAAGTLAGPGGSAATTLALLAAPMLIGLGYGLTNPAAADLLARHAPLSARGLYFSIKQTGVPIGVAAAGLLMPAGLQALGWRPSVAGVAAACAALALALQPLVRGLQGPTGSVKGAAAGGHDGSVAGAAAGPGGSAGPGEGIAAQLRHVWRTPALRQLSLASMAFALTQQVFVTFLVSLLNLRLGWTLAAAAGVLAASQAVSTAARIGFGALADRWGTPHRLLAQLGLAMAAGCGALALLQPATPGALVVMAALAVAATAMGWNGVFFAALAAAVPRADMARVSGTTQAFTFGGGMVGPLLFGESVRAGGSYAAALLVTALAPLAAAAMLARRDRTAALRPPGPAGRPPPGP